MTAVVAVRNASNLVKRLVRLHLSGPLPGIFHAISKEDVGLSDVDTTLVNSRFLGLRLSWHAITERSLAHGGPEVHSEHSRAHDMLFTRHLEPTVLGAVLEGPWASRAHWVDGCVRNYSCIVVTGVDTSYAAAKVGHDLYDSITISRLVLLKQVAHCRPISVLDGLEENVCVVEHPVVGAHALRTSA